MKKAFLQLHLAVFLAGFTGILGRMISLDQWLLVWYRLLLTAIALWMLAAFYPRHAIANNRDRWRLLAIGSIVALHWVSFYGSIKYANISISLVCFSSIGFFTALLEPVFFRVKVDRQELFLGILVIIGIACIFSFDPRYKTGILLGMISALLGTLFPILNRILLKRISPESVTLYELSGGLVFLTALLFPVWMKSPGTFLWPTSSDWVSLLVLALLCTVLAFHMSMNALRKISAFTVMLTYNLEPVYGIALAFLVFREDKGMGGGFYAGLGLILLAIVLQMVRVYRKHQPREDPRRLG